MPVLLLLGRYVPYCIVVQTAQLVPFGEVRYAVAVFGLGSPAKLTIMLYVVALSFACGESVSVQVALPVLLVVALYSCAVSLSSSVNSLLAKPAPELLISLAMKVCTSLQF